MEEGWKSLYNEEFRILNASPDIIRVNKSRKIRGAEHVACRG